MLNIFIMGNDASPLAVGDMALIPLPSAHTHTHTHTHTALPCDADSIAQGLSVSDLQHFETE